MASLKRKENVCTDAATELHRISAQPMIGFSLYTLGIFMSIRTGIEKDINFGGNHEKNPYVLIVFIGPLTVLS